MRQRRGRDDLGASWPRSSGCSSGPRAARWPALISVVVMLALGATVSWFLRRRFRAWRYLERNEDLIVARGVMVQRLSVVPYGRMQFVEVTAGPVERLFKLSTVKLHTAAAASDARIPGLEQAEAARLQRPADRAGRVDGGGHVTDAGPAPPAARRRLEPTPPAHPDRPRRPAGSRPRAPPRRLERPLEGRERDGRDRLPRSPSP